MSPLPVHAVLRRSRRAGIACSRPRRSRRHASLASLASRRSGRRSGRPPGLAPCRARGRRGPSQGRAAGALLLLAAIAANLFPAREARAWNDLGHYLITREAIERLPEPLKTLLSEDGNLERLQEASIAPDQWRREEKDRQRQDQDRGEHYTAVEKPKHFFDIDQIAGKAGLEYPFDAFPRGREAAVALVGRETLDAYGWGPWAAADALEAFADAFAQGRPDDPPWRQAGALAHYAADLHMPFHTTRNFDGQETGNEGIHFAVEVGLVKRNEPFFAAEICKDRGAVVYVEDAEAALFRWLIAANGRVAPILEADSAARRATGYNPGLPENKADLDDLPASTGEAGGQSERAAPYYRALQRELDARGNPVAASMRDASADVARLLYTAWVRAGKPLSLYPSAERREPAPFFPLEYTLLAVFALLFLFWPRRRRARS
jgi:hypothetical protein